MTQRSGVFTAVSTLLLAVLLHAFTHAFGSMLVPLYLLIRDDLRLPGIKTAALLVTVYGTFYAILSYPAGVMADRVSRKWILGVGLIFNAVAITLMGLTRRYELLIVLAAIGGISGTVFHPAANALVPEHFPKSPGMAIGLLGIGSGIGFFAGPQYSGWRAESAHWHWHTIANWQRPCVELGLAGIVAGFVFLLLAREARPPTAADGAAPPIHPPLGKWLRRRIAAIGLVLGCRDFGGIASISLASIFLQKAQGRDPKETGLILGAMMLMGVIANPLAVWLTPGVRRLPGLRISLILAGLTVATVPLFPRHLTLLALCIFQSFHLGSYAMSDAAILERVPGNRRGRVVGLFLSIAGTYAGLSPWAMGTWTDLMGSRASYPLPYFAPFATLGALIICSAFSTPIIAKLGQPQGAAIEPLSEIFPPTLEPAA